METLDLLKFELIDLSELSLDTEKNDKPDTSTRNGCSAFGGSCHGTCGCGIFKGGCGTEKSKT